MALKEAEIGESKTQGSWNTADENEVHPFRDKLEKLGASVLRRGQITFFAVDC